MAAAFATSARHEVVVPARLVMRTSDSVDERGD